MDAALRGHLGVVKMLLPHMEGQGLDEADDEEGRTALYWAAERGHEEVVGFLLSQGAAPGVPDEAGKTPCMRAAARGDVNVVKVLVAHMGGQGLDEADKWRMTALHWAAQGGHEEVVGFLLSQGAVIDTKGSAGMTPFMWAASMGHLGVVRILLPLMGEQGLDEPDDWGRTALYHAADGGHEEIVRTFLLAGADRTPTDGRGRTPLAIASEHGRQGCVEVFKVSMTQSILAVRHSIPVYLSACCHM
jgi:ankyrin repeat protein